MGLVCESTRPREAHTMHVHVHALHVRTYALAPDHGLVCESTRPSEAHTMHMHVHALHVHMGFHVYERTVYQPSLRKLRDLPCHVHIPVHST